MTTSLPIYGEFIDFIASGATAEEVAAFQVSEETKARAWELVRREKQNALSADEAEELATFSELEHILNVARGRAFQQLAQKNKAAGIK